MSMPWWKFQFMLGRYVATSTNLCPDNYRDKEENSLSNHQMSKTSPNSTFHACSFNKLMSASLPGLPLLSPLPSIGTNLTNKVKNWGKSPKKSLKSLTPLTTPLSPNNIIRIAPCAFVLRVLVNKPPFVFTRSLQWCKPAAGDHMTTFTIQWETGSVPSYWDLESPQKPNVSPLKTHLKHAVVSKRGLSVSIEPEL